VNYASVVNEYNDSKVYLCKLKDGRTLQLQVHDTCEFDNKAVYVLYNFEDKEDPTAYFECDVEEVLELIKFDRYEDEEDSFDNVDFKSIEKYLIDADVWQYSNTEELNEILKALDQPIIKGVGWGEEQKYLNSLDKDFGIVFYWSEYDDFSCYGDGYTSYVKVIGSVKKV
jgi:hypothetical protein